MLSLLYDLLYMLPVFFISVISLEDFCSLPLKSPLIYLFCFAIALATTCFFNVKSRFKYLVLGFLIILISGIVMLKAPESRVDFLLKNVWILWVLLISVLSEIIGKLSSSYTWIRRGIGILLLTAGIIFAIRETAVNRALISFAFLQILVCLIEDVQLHWVKTGDTEHRKHLVCLAPFLIVICLLTNLLPISSKPYDWKFAVSLWNSVVDTTKTLTKYLPGSGNDFSEMGFSEKTSMSGEISGKTKELMSVQLSEYAGNVVYVSGKSFDSFDGREWTAKRDNAENYRLFDLVETECAVRNYDYSHYSDYVKTTGVSIKYQEFNTRYLFVPGKAVLYQGLLSSEKYVEYNDAIIGAKKLGYGTEYFVKFDRLNLDKDIFSNLINNRMKITEDRWCEGVKIAAGSNVNASYEAYLDYVNQVHSIYEDNVTVSEALSEKLTEVYDGASTDWDKLKKLEEWFGTFTYTETPGEIPAYVDSAEKFLDYFILESRQGYCAHFATAFTLLARAEGLPARFVQGFYVNRSKSLVMITTNMIHAWPEVYFDDFGWIPFEPTPSFKRDNSWATSDSYYAKVEIKRNENYVEEAPVTEEIVDAPKESVKKEFPVKIVLIIFASCILFAVVFLFVYFVITKKKKAKKSMVELAKIYCAMNLHILAMLGYKMENTETLSEFKDRVLGNSDLEEDCLLFIEEFEEILYASKNDCKSIPDDIITSKENLYRKLYLKKGRRYFIYKMRLSVLFASKI